MNDKMNHRALKKRKISNNEIIENNDNFSFNQKKIKKINTNGNINENNYKNYVINYDKNLNPEKPKFKKSENNLMQVGNYKQIGNYNINYNNNYLNNIENENNNFRENNEKNFNYLNKNYSNKNNISDNNNNQVDFRGQLNLDKFKYQMYEYNRIFNDNNA
jgi:hypothetical protein